MKKKAKPFTWITADKIELTLDQFGDEHLVNAIRMIERGMGLYNPKSDRPETWPRDRAETHAPNWRAAYAHLVGEAVRRGLFDWSPRRKMLKQTIVRARKEAKLPLLVKPVLVNGGISRKLLGTMKIDEPYGYDRAVSGLRPARHPLDRLAVDA